jgi:SpoVK/Ycf46/Vps4 family AAA+-type ATPase/membrane protein implicated in regulation of membrane protease activity
MGIAIALFIILLLTVLGGGSGLLIYNWPVTLAVVVAMIGSVVLNGVPIPGAALIFAALVIVAGVAVNRYITNRTLQSIEYGGQVVQTTGGQVVQDTGSEQSTGDGQHTGSSNQTVSGGANQQPSKPGIPCPTLPACADFYSPVRFLYCFDKSEYEKLSDTDRALERVYPDPSAFDKIIGLAKAKDDLTDTLQIILANKSDEGRRYQEYKVKPIKGILLYGPPGTGKTSFARAAARRFAVNFIVVNAAAVANMYIGQTEQNIRDIFQFAGCHKPCIIFWDEFDAIARKRGGTVSTTVSETAINTLLTCLDGFAGNDGVVVVAATNRKDVLDDAVLRPGRFDKLIEVGLPEMQDREKLFDLYLQGRPNDLGVDDLKKLAGYSDGMSPAEIAEAVNEAARRSAKPYVPISWDIVLAAIREQSSKGAGMPPRPVDEILAELEAMPGLASVKKKIRQYIKLAEANQQALETGEESRKISLHLAFEGSPGTGKTMVAKLIGELLASVGIFRSFKPPQVVNASTMQGTYVGQTQEKVQGIINNAMDGVLLIDEAYALADDQKTFGGEALTILIQAMEDNRDRMMVIVAGYPGTVDKLAQVNPGIRSRFGSQNILTFDDYSAKELYEIAVLEMKKQCVEVDDDTKAALLTYFKKIAPSTGKLGNGRHVRGMIEQAMLSALDHDHPKMLSVEDFGIDVSTQAQTVEEVWIEINSLIGLEPVKQFLREIAQTVTANKTRADQGLALLTPGYHMSFVGPPGTGKTTIARLVAKLLAALGVLSDPKCIETDRGGLVGQVIGETAQKTKAVLDRALGGVLFIDEAYALATGSGGAYQDFGAEALATIVKYMEDHRQNIVVILAGYEKEMQSLFELNSGLKSRIDFTCEFPNYSADELVEITNREVKLRDFTLSPDIDTFLLDLFRKTDVEHAGNGRYARKLVEQAIRKAVSAGRVDVLSVEDFA